MAFNTRKTEAARAPKPAAVIQTTGPAVNAKGAVAFRRDAKSELFLLAVGRFHGKDDFYEKSMDAEDRLIKLVHQVAIDDPQWLLGFTVWLRSSGFIRTAAIVIGLEGAKAISDLTSAPIWQTVRDSALHDYSGEGYARKLARAGILRGDEPGEALAYWASKYGRVTIEGGKASSPKLPKPIKRGIADALTKVANERNAAKYDTGSKGYRWADLIRLTHPKPVGRKQEILFKYLLDRAKNPQVAVPSELGLLSGRKQLLAPGLDVTQLSSAELKAAGVTWENIASDGPMDAAKWEAAIPNMNYMALLRNLRNFDIAGICDASAAIVQEKLTNPIQVGMSKQFPLRFLTAWMAVPSLRWSYPLAKALDISLARVPALPGRTLVLVDTSGSMATEWSGESEPRKPGAPMVQTPLRQDAAALFGIALATRSVGVELWSYGGSGWGYGAGSRKQFTVRQGAETLKELGRWMSEGFNIGGGTPTAETLRATFDNQDQVILITDEQHDSTVSRTIDQLIPKSTPMFTFNMGGYAPAQTPSEENRYVLGGLNDAAFQLIDWTRMAGAHEWPWETRA